MLNTTTPSRQVMKHNPIKFNNNIIDEAYAVVVYASDFRGCILGCLRRSSRAEAASGMDRHHRRAK